MNCILFDDNRLDLLPLTYTRPVPDIRVGILTIREKWERFLSQSTSTITVDYLQEKYSIQRKEVNTLINGSILPTNEIIKAITNLDQGIALTKDEVLIACVLKDTELDSFINGELEGLTHKEWEGEFLQLNNSTDIFRLNGPAIESDYQLITEGRDSASISSTNQLLGNNIFVEEGAKIECACINSTTGPVYIGENAEIMEGSIIRGPFALCESSTLKMGAKIYGPTTVGPYSKVGGEVNNSVILGCSNKGHDGFLGNSVIGEWCNLGADTNNSNLKNNYADVKLWDYETERFKQTGLQFCGLIMGDHSKCGINTMFNTGTVVGVSSNIFGAGFPRNFIPSFCWGPERSTYDFNTAIDVAIKVMERRKVTLTQTDRDILSHIFSVTEKYRGK